MSDSSHNSGFIFWHIVRLVLMTAIFAFPVVVGIFGISIFM